MKRCLFLCTILLLMVWVRAVAQSTCMSRTPEQEAQKHTEMMKRELQLSEAQLDTIYRLNLKYAILRRQAQSRAEMMGFFEKMTQELRTLLTTAQFEQYMEHQRDNGPKRPSLITNSVTDSSANNYSTTPRMVVTIQDSTLH